MNNTRNDESPEWFAINATIVNRKARDEAKKLKPHSGPAISWIWTGWSLVGFPALF